MFQGDNKSKEQRDCEGNNAVRKYPIEGVHIDGPDCRTARHSEVDEEHDEREKQCESENDRHRLLPVRQH